MSFFRNRVFAAASLFFVGCNTGTVSTTPSTGSGANAKTQAVATSEDVLTSAIFQLRPENFGINANVEKPVSLLNSWRFKQSEQDGTAEEPAPVKAPAGWVAADDEARLAQPKFDIQDAMHIRDALFYHAVSVYVSDRGRDEFQRVGVVVDFVCRNIALWKDDELEIPLIPFMSLLLGRGSAYDRALICSEILRQLRIDSVVIRAKSDVKEMSDKWLFGAVIDGKICLYDLRLGLPLAGNPETKSDSPATLTDIAAHPEWLEQMATKEPYRLKADDLREPQIAVVSGPNYWCQRMHKLEQVLPAGDACVIYAPLITDDGKNGILSRIASAASSPVESLSLWGFPARQAAKGRQMTKEFAEELPRLMTPLVVPIPLVQGKDGKMVPGTPEHKFHRYRIDHLLGKFSEATQRYLSIRHLEVEPNPPEIERLNRMASDDAFYWTALCKTELQDYAGAIELLKDYLKKYDRKGRWFFAARSLLAQCHAQLGNLPEAISTLERSSSEDPNQIANAIRLKRWIAARSQ